MSSWMSRINFVIANQQNMWIVLKVTEIKSLMTGIPIKKLWLFIPSTHWSLLAYFLHTYPGVLGSCSLIFPKWLRRYLHSIAYEDDDGQGGLVNYTTYSLIVTQAVWSAYPVVVNRLTSCSAAVITNYVKYCLTTEYCRADVWHVYPNVLVNNLRAWRTELQDSGCTP